MSGTPAANHNTVRFLLDGEIITLQNVDPTRTVLQFLREDLGRCGTKEGCAEGDCGACTIVLIELDRSGERLKIRAINSCIQFLPTLHGREILTVESLRGNDGALHPVQQAMVECHGSQCGFCTPGFVMSLFAQYKTCSRPTRREIDDALAGNLCRCTGYQPIVNAARAMYESDSADNNNWLLQACDDSGMASPEEKEKVVALTELGDDQPVSIAGDEKHFAAPQTIDEFADLFLESPTATILAGGTDVGLWVTKQHKTLEKVIYTGRVNEMIDIVVSDECVDIGAAVTLSDLMPALDDYFPCLHDLFVRFASPPIRNAGTLGGNVANGSPIGDSMPALLVLDAKLVLRKGKVSRTLPLDEFYLGYQKNALEAGEFLVRIQIPRVTDSTSVRSYKISKRFDQDISAVCGAFRLQLDGESIQEIRIAYGGLAVTPKRASETEKQLAGAAWNEETIQSAMKMLQTDFQPISDMRSSADYRLKICRNLLHRFWLDVSDESIATDVYGYGR